MREGETACLSQLRLLLNYFIWAKTEQKLEIIIITMWQGVAPTPGRELHSPVIFLNLNADDLSTGQVFIIITTRPRPAFG